VPPRGDLALHLCDERSDIVAAVAVLGDLLPARERPDRLAELTHLGARVVDVELALELMAVEGEHTRERIAVGRVAGVTDVHGTGWVGGHELDDDPLGRERPAATEALARGEHLRECGAVPAIREEQVQESGSRHLEALELLPEPCRQRIAELLGQLARRDASGGRQQQRCVGGVVAEVSSRGALERDRLVRARAAGELSGEGEHGLAQAGLSSDGAHRRGSYAPACSGRRRPLSLGRRARSQPDRRRLPTALEPTRTPSPAQVAILAL
jgi:hypothetical protein